MTPKTKTARARRVNEESQKEENQNKFSAIPSKLTRLHRFRSSFLAIFALKKCFEAYLVVHFDIKQN